VSFQSTTISFLLLITLIGVMKLTLKLHFVLEMFYFDWLIRKKRFKVLIETIH